MKAGRRIPPPDLCSTEQHTPSSNARAARRARGYKGTAYRLTAASLKEGKDIFIFLFLNKNSHIFSSLDFIFLCIYVLPGMAPKFMSTSDTSNKSLLIPSLGSSGFSASLSLLASFNISGLKSCLNIHLATLSAMPPTVWRQEGK